MRALLQASSVSDQSFAAKKTAVANIRRTVQTRLRKIQYASDGLLQKADEIQKYDDTQDSMMPYMMP